ncbi:MAG: aminoglycoside phosphotransferase family protein [Dysgonomonas sp.]|nr:aminoglycoside phosphotransferase family protein [Dysgonomonas sp.]
MIADIKKHLLYYISLWNLVRDGESFFTHSSLLQPVLYKNKKAILKIFMVDEEKKGAKLMIWWNGVGAVKVFEYSDDAILMERIANDYSLTAMAINNQDDKATQIICNVANLLHSYNHDSYPELVTLEHRFVDLFLFADKYGEVFKRCADIAKNLLKNQQDRVILHGDLHHENILHSANRGWLAIDPKGIIGERAFDYVNILCNPNAEVALKKGRFLCQIELISKEAKISCENVLKWAAAWSGLSAIWSLNEGRERNIAFEVASIALQELNIR